jgi:hypothetical protein
MIFLVSPIGFVLVVTSIATTFVGYRFLVNCAAADFAVA